MITISNPEKYVVGILVRLSNERIDDYIEEYFQLKGVRFVAVNENLDSKTSANFHDDIKIRAFFNEWFLRDCSKKTRDGKHNKALQGKVMATYPKYRI